MEVRSARRRLRSPSTEFTMRVFVSSTALDLAAHRAVAKDVILELGWQPVLFMEQQSIPAGPSVPSCQQMVQSCDQFLLIVGHRCGWIPSRQQGGNGVTSITEIELATWAVHQKQRGRNVRHPLIMMSSSRQAGSSDGPPEDDLHKACQTMFRTRLKESGLLVNEFAMPTDAAGIPESLQGFRQSLTTLASKLRVLAAEQELRSVKGTAIWAAALAFVVGAALAGPGHDSSDADW